MALKLAINGVNTELANFAISEMSLSSARAAMQQHEFELRIQVEDLLRCLEADYQKWVLDSKADDALCGSPQDALAEANYPPLIEVVKNPVLLELVVGSYLLESLVNKFSHAGENTQYWFDKVLSCRYVSGLVVIRGICYS